MHSNPDPKWEVRPEQSQSRPRKDTGRSGRCPRRLRCDFEGFHSGGHPPQSMHCRDYPQRPRAREAFAVRLHAGVLGAQRSSQSRPGSITCPAPAVRSHRRRGLPTDQTAQRPANRPPADNPAEEVSPKPESWDNVEAVLPARKASAVGSSVAKAFDFGRVAATPASEPLEPTQSGHRQSGSSARRVCRSFLPNEHWQLLSPFHPPNLFPRLKCTRPPAHGEFTKRVGGWVGRPERNRGHRDPIRPSRYQRRWVLSR